ncbi:MAG: murein L,D-transpeptidase catalytic domain family protein [Bacteroidota bacterium]|nr:MAG: murein L,D-transpeptidase catalytic domain family protein [Bacteroidota bacterium]
MKKFLLFSILLILSLLFIRGVVRSDEPASVTNHYFNNQVLAWCSEFADTSLLSKEALLTAYDNFLLAYADSLVQNDSLLSVIDFTKPSTEPRLFIFDVKNKRLLYKSLVAHGQNSGELFAQNFSNKPQSHMSSLGMFRTLNTYEGRHGYSLRLDGLQKGINDKAKERAIVIHGAAYVSPNYIEQYGRIGRSFGCPALPADLNASIIDLIKNGSFLFIYHPSLIS